MSFKNCHIFASVIKLHFCPLSKSKDMSSSEINEAVKEAVIAEVKKLTGYNPSTPNQLFQHLEGNFSVKYVPDIFLRIAVGDLVIFFSPRVSPSDLVWQKAAEMLKICWEVQKTEDDPKRKKVLEVIKAKAQECLGWDSFDVHVTEDAGFDEFWATIEKFYGKEVPSPEGSHLIDLRVSQGLSRADYLEIIVDEVLKHLNKPHQDYTYPETIFPDKSAGYYFNQLKEPLRTKALSQAKNLSEPAEGLAWAVDTAQILSWDSTVEGFDFWQHVYDYLNAATLYPNSEGSKLAAQCAPDNYVFPHLPKKEAPEYIPPTPPVNPIEVALAEIDKLKIRVEMIEYVKDVEIKALRKHHAETELDAKTLANLAYNRVSAFIGQGITPSQSDFETWWTEFRKENGYATEQPTKPEYAPTHDQIYTLWLLVKDGDKSFPDALPYKVAVRKFQPSVLQVEVQDNFEFTISPTKFYPLANSKGERPTFDQCRQAIAGTLASTLETLFNDGKK